MRSFALALALGCAAPVSLTAQTVRDFMGAYDLRARRGPGDSGEWVTTTETFGPGAQGIIMYDGVGSMSSTSSGAGAPPPGETSPTTGATRSTPRAAW